MPVDVTGAELGVQNLLLEGQVVVLWPSSDVVNARCHHRHLAAAQLLES